MIPWMREKIAERRAKWEASRKRDNFSSETIGVSDRIPLQKDVSYDSIEILNETTGNDILLKIISYDGRLITLRVVTTITIEEVKFRALTELLPPHNDERGTRALNYKLVKSSESMFDLNESKSIGQNNLSDCDELLLLKCSINNQIVGRPIHKGPSQTAIDQLTMGKVPCGEVDVNEIMLRCDVYDPFESFYSNKIPTKIHST